LISERLKLCTVRENYSFEGKSRVKEDQRHSPNLQLDESIRIILRRIIIKKGVKYGATVRKSTYFH
jgi:hypothetical protein